MIDDPSFFLRRRRFIAAAAGTALVAAVEVGAAPPLGRYLGKPISAPNSWIEVDLNVFERNLKLVQAMLVGGARFCAVLKANAYGVGIEHVMPKIIEAGISHVAIASNEEARMVRDSGFRGKVMRVRAATLPEIAAAIPHDVEELVGGLEQAQGIARMRRRRPAPIHLSVNSAGMSRSGFELRAEAGRRDMLELMGTEGLRVVGVMTHFPVEELADVRQGLAAFRHDIAWLFDNTMLRREDVLLHTANSFAIQNVPEAHLDMVRPGGAMYGYSGTPKPPFEHVIAFKTRVATIQAYPAGSTVSYDRTFTLKRDSLLANLSVGYSDGYARAYSNKGSVLIRGQRAPVVGRVTMNSTMVDVTDIPGVQPGDEVVLFGKQGADQITQVEAQEVSGIGLSEQYTAWGVLNPKVIVHR
ncbi:alanine racemase [Luteimonas sp. e5]